MAKEVRLWEGVDEKDFINEHNLEDVDIATYDKRNMVIYGANINLCRQLLRLSDSLKPVERRLLYSLWLAKAFPGHKLKSTVITGNAMVYHGHGDSALYSTMVGLAQAWKRQCPLIDGKGNFGNAARPDMYAHMRYTEASMSKYAKECFFDDFDTDCVEMIFNSASDLYEPMSLPAKFPNALVNGGMGIAFGNAFMIPPYNIYDIIDVCKKVIENPETADVFMVPDLPSGCAIVDDGHSFQDIIDTGKSVLKMRATNEILETNKTWIIKITSLPWTTSVDTIESKIIKLAEEGQISIKDMQDHSYTVKDKNGSVQTRIDFRIILDKAHDPHAVLYKLYALTDLQKSVSVDFKVVLDNLTVGRLDMRNLIISWIDERRGYKRRLFNKKLTKISARIDLLTILIYLLKEDNIEKTLKIIKNSDSSEIVSKLMKHGKMSSYQASKIADMRLSAFTKDARKRYKDEKEKLVKERDELMKIIGSEKKIDKIIIDELEDLRKYGSPRKSKIVSEGKGKVISNTMHSIITTDGGLIKKLIYDPNNLQKNTNMGSFKTGDFPTQCCVCHNTSSIIMVDSFGRYSIVPVHDIDSTELSSYGNKVYDVTRLSGKVVQCMEPLDKTSLNTIKKKKLGEAFLISITARGYIKKTPINIFEGIKNTKNIRLMKVRDDDMLVASQVMLDSTILVVYTARGDYTMLKVSDIPEQGKDTMGVIGMKVEDGDRVAGLSTVGPDDEFLVIITDKGICKKVEARYFGEPSKRNGRKGGQGNIISLDTTDTVKYVGGMRRGQLVYVAMRNNVVTLDEKSIPNLTKKAKGRKMIPSGGNSNIVMVLVSDKLDKG